MISTREAVDADFRAMLGFRPAGIRLAYVAVDGERPIAVAGVMRDPAYVGSILEEEGRWIAFFETQEELPFSLAARIVVQLGRGLQQMQEEVWVQCDNSHATAERFCRMLGFQPTDQFSACWRDPKRKLRMWKWQR